MKSRRWIAGFAAVFMTVALAPAIAEAAPKSPKKPVARISKTVELSAQRTDIWVYSPAMGGRIRVSVLSPPGATAPRSTLYMLDGAGNHKDVSDWITKGHAGRFFADKDVNVVLPAGASGTFYTDWQKHDPKLGKPMWETFLTKELPPLIDERFNGNGRNAILGLSMGGQAAFALTVRNPSMYTGVASLSGCPPVSGPFNEAYVRTTVGRDGGDATNMWGPFGSAGWRAHDPSHHLDKLRGKNIFLAAGSGAVGPLDLQRRIEPEEGSRDVVTASSSALELGAYRCSLEFALTLRANRIPYTDGFRLIGTHTWGYWERDLEVAWPTLARGL